MRQSTPFRSALSIVIATSIGLAGFMQSAHATLIGTEQVAAASQGTRSAEASRAHVLATLNRADIAAALSERGVDLDQARERVAALTDAEAVQLAERIDSAPAGGDVLATIGFIFVLLLITDILGLTKVFPFTRSVR